jgi:hypothetical protein
LSPIDIPKAPAPAAAPTTPARTPTAPAANQGRQSAQGAADQGPQSAPTAAPIMDRADIRPLDVPAALQILLAEVRAAFVLQAVAMGEGEGASEPVSGPPQAAHALLQMLIRAMPDETADMPTWTAALARVETAVQTGLNRGIEAVTLWRDVPVVVVDAAKDTRTLAFSMLGDDPPNPVWLRPEWAGLAPSFERFRRRRRLARRLLRDPDYSPRHADDDSEQRS